MWRGSAPLSPPVTRKRRRAFAAALSGGAPGMARSAARHVWSGWYPTDDLGVEVLCGPWVWVPLADGKGARSDPGSEGSPRQSAGLTNRKRI